MNPIGFLRGLVFGRKPAVWHPVADHCIITIAHEPAPLRFVTHHVLPQECGGKTTPENTVPVCDNCHYAIHAMLYELKTTHAIRVDPRKDPQRIDLAQQGYDAAIAAGTADKIPNEGSAVLMVTP